MKRENCQLRQRSIKLEERLRLREPGEFQDSVKKIADQPERQNEKEQVKGSTEETPNGSVLQSFGKQA